MIMTPAMWTSLMVMPMQWANPADLVAQGNIVIPPDTGFCYKLGGSQSWGLYFPNGGEIFVGGMYAADAQHPIEVWDDSVSGKSTKAGRGSSQLEEKTFGIPGFLVGDTGAQGLQFSLGANISSPIPATLTTQPINIAPFLSGTAALTGHPPVPAVSVAPGDYTAYAKQQGITDDDQKQMPKSGGKAAKIIAFGNWDVVPVYFAPKD